jgi:glucose/galactose transporter
MKFSERGSVITGNNSTIGKWRGLILPMILIAFMFSILGFAIGINAFFVPFVQEAYHVSTSMSYLITTATFSAYLLFGIPSGILLKRTGYKGSMVVAFIIMALGMLLIVPAAKWITFPMFLLAIFVTGLGQTLLNAAVNPYITLIGPHESAAQRICIMGICNKLTTGLTPVFLALFMNTTNIKLEDTIGPFYIISGGLFLLGILIFFSPLPELKGEGEEHTYEYKGTATSVQKTSILQYPHLLLGALGLFFSIGVEITALVSINDLATEIGMPTPERFTGFVSGAMILGYLMGVILIPRRITQSKAFTISSLIGIATTLLIVTLPQQRSVYFVAVLGMANAVLWPSIWPLALADLGRFTKTGSAILVMGVVGGGIIPLLLGWLKDLFSYQQAYWMLLPLYIYLLYYAIKGHKIRK